MERFVTKFVKNESYYFDYNRVEKKNIRKRLKEGLRNYLKVHERNTMNYIHYLKRKNKQLEKKLLENIVENESEQDNESNSVDEQVNDVYTHEEYVEGLKHVAWAFVRMVALIYLSVFIVHLYDLSLKNVNSSEYKTLEGE